MLHDPNTSGTSGDLEEIHRRIQTPGRVLDRLKLSSQIRRRPVSPFHSSHTILQYCIISCFMIPILPSSTQTPELKMPSIFNFCCVEPIVNLEYPRLTSYVAYIININRVL
jgi:hypothetical protein